MSAQIHVPASEQGLVRVFALSMPSEEVSERVKTVEETFALLGPDGPLDNAHIALFEVADIQEIGLTEYLVEGGDVTEETIGTDQAKLNSLDGWVMVVYSRAFGQKAMTLTPIPEMTLIGTYGQHRTDWQAKENIDSDSAKPYSAPPETVKKKPSDAAMSGRVATLVLLVLAVFTAVFIWIAG
ncbi:MAG: hypothetical protein ABJX32_10010 [Tateyamaria sp.]|uniref:hypothetical protein n=1 Tax=Tateyamaria sp. TaxID=1929288 RepID=UPI00329F02D5